MSVTLTYESTLSRVRIDVTGLGQADNVNVDRSLDQVNWTAVRCGVGTPTVTGTATIYDYEFVSGVVNYYRASSAADATFVASSAAVHANNANVTPTIPVGSTAGDLLLIWAAIRTGGGNPNIPGGYTMLRDIGNSRLFGKIHSGSESNPTVTFVGGSAGDDTSAQMATFRNVQLSVANTNFRQLTASAQNIVYDALTVTPTHPLLLFLGWKQDDWTGVGTLPALAGDPAVEIGDPSTTTGNDQGIVWDYVIQTTTTPTNVPAGSFVVTGGASAISSSAVLALPPNQLVQTNSITPTITTVWLKSITKPFLNRTFFCVPPAGDVTRDSRSGIFEIINRSFPVTVTDLKQSRAVQLRVITQTTTQWQDLDLILSTGEVMFLHTPLNYELPSMYVDVGQTTMHRPLLNRACDVDWREFTLPLREVAAPDPTICGSTVTWQSVINTYATWQAVLNNEVSWFDLLSNVGTPNDVIVP